jgi:hypothetical protein
MDLSWSKLVDRYVIERENALSLDRRRKLARSWVPCSGRFERVRKERRAGSAFGLAASGRFASGAAVARDFGIGFIRCGRRASTLSVRASA